MLKAMIDLKGSYSLVIMTENKLYAVRDPYGNRPLCLGKIGEDGYVVASESCALDAIGATFLRDVEPGEILNWIQFQFYHLFPHFLSRHNKTAASIAIF